ncbi:MAG: AsmA-like C-terminal domain-containing protein [Candidatus Rokubacteria bacterium]|nr:AsmA-like C-terminal domain-containing protein [Candidatus Rokubacteria bacterium]
MRRRGMVVLLASVLALVLLVGGGLLYVRTRTAREQIRALVERVLAQELNLPVRVGSVSLSLGLGSVELRHLTITDRPTDTPLLEADRVRVTLALASLLGGDLRVKSVSIRGPRLSLEDTPRLRAILGAVVARLKQLSRDREGEGFPIRVEQGVITYRNAPAGMSVRLAGLAGRLSWPSPERAAVMVTADAVQLSLGGRRVSDIRLEARARAGRDVTEVEGLKLDRGGSTLTLAGVILTPTEVPRVELTATGELALDELASAIGGGKGWSGKLSVEGKLFGEGFPRTFEGRLGVLDGSLAGMPARLVTAAVLLRPERLEAAWLTALVGGGTLRGSGFFEPGAARWRGSVQLTDVDLQNLLQILGPPFSLAGRATGSAEGSGQGKDPAQLALRVNLSGRELRLSDKERRAEGELGLSARQGLLRLERFSLKRGESRLTLRGSVDLRTEAVALIATGSVADLAKDLWPWDVRGLGGQFSLSGRVGHTLRKPLFRGRMSVKSLRFRGWRADLVEGPVEAELTRLASPALRLSAGRTAATVSGEMRLDQSDLHLDLSADLRGRIEDVVAQSPTDWPVAGPVVLHARLGGTLSSLEGGGQVEMRELRVGAERLETLRATLAFKGAELTIPRLTARRGGVPIQADAAIGASGRYRFSVLPVTLDLSTLPELGALGARGNAVLRLRGAGQWSDPRVEGEIALADAGFRDIEVGNGSARFTLNGKQWLWDLSLAHGLKARGALPLALSGPVRAELTATNLDLMPFLPGVRASVLFPLTARTDGSATFRGTLPGLRDLSGLIELTALRGEAAGVAWRARDAVRLELKAGTLRFESLDLVGSDLAVAIKGSIRPGERTDLALSGHVPFPIVGPWVPPLAAVRGTPEGRLSLAGPPDNVRVAGRADLTHVDVKLKALPVWITVGQGDVRFDTDSIQYAIREGAAGGGRLEGQGAARRQDGFWGHMVDFKLDKAQLEQIYDQLRTERRWASGDLFVRGSLAFDASPGQAVLPTLHGRLAVTLEGGSLARYPALVRIFGLLGTPAQPFRLPDLTRERMPYRRLSADFSVKDGVMETRDLVLDSEVVRVSAVGTVRLADQHVNLDLAVRPLQVLEQGIRKIPLLGRLLPQEQSLVVAYFDMEGPWADPSISMAPVKSLSQTVVDILLLLLRAPERVISPSR